MDAAGTDARVRRELLRLAMRNAGRSVVPQAVVIGVACWLGWSAGQTAAAMAAGAVGYIGVAWRWWISRRYADPSGLDEAGLSRASRLLQGNAAVAGLFWVLASAGILPSLSGAEAITFFVMACGATAVASYFLSLVGHSFVLLVLPQLAALTWICLFVESSRSYLLAALIPIYGLNMYRAARELTKATTRAIEHGLEVEDINASLEQAKTAAELANSAKSQFLATMSHEIRTPMNGVLGALELLRRSGLNAQQQRLVRTAASSGESLMAILNDVLDHSKLEAGKLVLAHASLSLPAVAASVVALFRANAEQKQLQLELEVDPQVDGQVLGDPQRLKQVLLNLVGNAIKFTESGIVRLRLTHAPAPAGRVGARFEVSDTGIGIAPDAQALLFQPFHQVAADGRSRSPGTGLGLSISQSIVLAMGGRIELISDRGRGSTFAFTLHFEPDPGPRPADAPDSALPPLDMATEVADGVVLVVEDNPVNRLIASDMLASLGTQCIQAEDGAHALDLLATRTVDLVLMDCEMPVMDGYTATRLLRTREREQRLPRTPVVAVTANAFDDDAMRTTEAGMDGHLTKPYTREQLREVLRTWL